MINPGHQRGESRFSTRLTPRGTPGPGLGSVLLPKENSSTAKLGIRAAKGGASPRGEKQEAFPKLWGKRSNIKAGTLLFSPRWGVKFQVRQQPLPKPQGKSPQNRREEQSPHPAHPAGRSQALEQVSGTRNVWTPALKLGEKRKELIPPLAEREGGQGSIQNPAPPLLPGAVGPRHRSKIVLDTNLE